MFVILDVLVIKQVG